MSETVLPVFAKSTVTPWMLALGGESLGGDSRRIRLRLPFAPASSTEEPGAAAAIDLRAVAALLDHAGGAAVYAALPGLKGTATLELHLDLLGKPVPGQDVHASAGCIAVDAASALVTGEAWCGGLSEPHASTPIARLSCRFIVGAGPGQRAGPEAQRLRERTAAEHVPVPPPLVRSFGELLGGRAQGHAFELPPAPWRVGSIALPALHGGVVAAGLMTAAALVAAESPGLSLRSLTVQYLRAAHVEDTRFAATVLKRGARVAYLSAEATQRHGERRVATLQCLYA
ncbi:MAG TPA: hotdog domain-containing protein [Burkholderiaceae bacterium]|jgi:acyl-coenzyme A thioesterase PaaI-like protein